MLEHRLERMRIAVAHEPEVARRNLEAGHIADAVIAREMPLEHRQPATVVVERRAGNRGPLLPQPARRVQHVEMRQIPASGNVRRCSR